MDEGERSWCSSLRSTVVCSAMVFSTDLDVSAVLLSATVDFKIED
jgi:hypothetical protein